MITLLSFFDYQVEFGKAIAISNSVPEFMKGIDTVECLVPCWDVVQALKNGRISEAEYTEKYRAQLKANWKTVKRWLQGLDAEQDLVLMCWCKTGKFCHRLLVAKMLSKWRPDIKLEVR